MLALITEVVASAAPLGGGSRRGVGVLLSLEWHREPQDVRRRDAHLGYRVRRGGVSDQSFICSHKELQKFSAGP